MKAREFMRLWQAEEEASVYIELPDGTLCNVDDLYQVADKLLIVAGQEVI